MKKTELKTANERLEKLYGNKHKAITTNDINAVFSRSDLLSVAADAKTVKGQSKGYLTGILYLSPSDQFTRINLCPFASKGCRESCLFTAGRGKFYSVTRARVIKTLAFLTDPVKFLFAVSRSIDRLKTKAEKLGLTPVVRLNGTSDIDWARFNMKKDVLGEKVSFSFLNDNRIENLSIFERHRNIQFYDYTKDERKVKRAQPANYHLTFSLSEGNHITADGLPRNINIAAVFTGNKPLLLFQRPLIDGDKTDLRFTDPIGVIVALTAKGEAKKDKTGFVIRGKQCNQ